VDQPLPSYKLKIDWAGYHLKLLNQVRRGWLDGPGYRIAVEKEPKTGYTVHRAEISEPLPPQLLLLVGDVVHNLRSALDHLALELAIANFRPDPVPGDIERDSEFPIFPYMTEAGEFGEERFFRTKRNSPEPAPGSGLSKLRGIDPDALRIIEGIQPYHRRIAFWEDPLWVIHELDRIDKHRRLNVVAYGIVQTIISKGDIDVRKMGHSGPVEDGTELLSFKSSDPNVHADTTREISFGQGSPAEYEFVVPALARLREFVGQEIVPLLEPYS
jgi:hypothetical protein